MNTVPAAPALPRATLLATTSCHLCDDAHQELERRASLGQLSLQVVSVESDQGRALLSAHRPPMFPLVILDGRVIGHGRLSRRRLEAALRKAGAR